MQGKRYYFMHIHLHWYSMMFYEHMAMKERNLVKAPPIYSTRPHNSFYFSFVVYYNCFVIILVGALRRQYITC